MLPINRIYPFRQLLNSTLYHQGVDDGANNKFQDIKTKQPQNINPTETSIANQAKIKESNEKNIWKNLSPFINAYAKIVASVPDKPSAWMLVWVKSDAALFYNFPYKPIPEESKLYEYLISQDAEKQKRLLECEKLLVNSYMAAKDFVSGGLEVQSGFEIVGEKDYAMRVRGFFGIEVSYSYVDCVLEAIENNSKDEINCWQQFFTGVFAHEMTHELREEIYQNGDTGQEIASHAVEILSTGGDNLLADLSLSKKISEPDTSYNKDIITGLKVLQQKLSQSNLCQYKPKTHEPSELNRAMQSIPEDKKEEVLKNLAQEIIKTPAIDLLRIAAQVNVVPMKKANVIDLLKRLEEAS